LRQLGKLNGGARNRPGLDDLKTALDTRVSRKRHNGGRIIACHRKPDRIGIKKPKRLRPALGEHKMRLNRGAKTSKGGQPRICHAIDWQSQRRHATRCDVTRCDHRRTSGPEFRNAAFNCHVLGLAEQGRVAATIAATVTTHRIPLILADSHILADTQILADSHGPSHLTP